MMAQIKTLFQKKREIEINDQIIFQTFLHFSLTKDIVSLVYLVWISRVQHEWSLRGRHANLTAPNGEDSYVGIKESNCKVGFPFLLRNHSF